MSDDIVQKPYTTGSDLKTKIETATVELFKPFIDGFLYENSALMVYADDGLGKSLLMLQAVLESGCGQPVFNYFEVPKPLKTLWIQAERHENEVISRMKVMRTKIPINYDNLIIDTSFQGLDLIKQDDRDLAIQRLDHIFTESGGFDLVVIDPIYALVSGGLSNDKEVSCITKFSTMTQKRYGCSILMIHHTNRGCRDLAQGGIRTEGDMYGSRFLSAHFSGIYHIKQNQSKNGTEFKLIKSSHSNLTKKFTLTFDSEFNVSYVDSSNLSKYDRVMAFLKACKSSNKTFTFSEICTACDLSTDYLNKLKYRGQLSGMMEVSKSIGKASLYKFLG